MKEFRTGLELHPSAHLPYCEMSETFIYRYTDSYVGAAAELHSESTTAWPEI